MNTYKCECCGAMLYLNINKHIDHCLYCGNTIVYVEDELSKLNIKKMIPFSIDKDEAIQNFKTLFNKNVVDAKKVYVPVRFSNFHFNYLYHFQYRVENDNDHGRSYSYYNLESLLDGEAHDEMIFGDGKINYINLAGELDRSSQIDFDPAYLSDVSVEIPDFDSDEVSKLIHKKIEDYSMEQYAQEYDIVRSYSKNYIVSNLKMDSFSTLIPVYVIHTDDGILYNIPGVPLRKVSQKKKHKNLIFSRFGTCVVIAFALFFVHPFIGFLALCGVFVFYNNEAWEKSLIYSQDYVCFTSKRKDFKDEKRKKLKI